MPFPTPPVTFTGKWKYQSFLPKVESIRKPFDIFSDNPIFVPWSPPGTLTVNADGGTGELQFPNGLRLALVINLIQGTPATLQIKAQLPPGSPVVFTNELQGWFSFVDPSMPEGPKNPVVVRGSIIQTSADIPKAPFPQPLGSVGYFILEPDPSPAAG